MKYIAPRNMVVSSKNGRSAEFVKGEPTFAPSSMHGELILLGFTTEEPIPPLDPNEPRVLNAAERDAALFAVFEKLVLRAHRSDFTASGAPHGAVLAKELGWEVSGKERDAAYSRWNQARSTESEKP